MRACVQRVTRAKVTLGEEGEATGEIGLGFVVLLGVGRGDTAEEVRLLARKIGGLRVFDDEQGKMNRSLTDVGGSLLVVSQFTLYADSVRGNRPGFTDAALPDDAVRLYDLFVWEMKDRGFRVETGVFQANMKIELVNSGPVTIWLDTDVLRPKKVDSP